SSFAHLEGRASAPRRGACRKPPPPLDTNHGGAIPLAVSQNTYFPRTAASILATSIFFIGIIASNARLATAPPAAIASVSTRGVICHDRPQRSLHQPHWLSWPPLPTMAFQ